MNHRDILAEGHRKGKAMFFIHKRKKEDLGKEYKPGIAFEWIKTNKEFGLQVCFFIPIWFPRWNTKYEFNYNQYLLGKRINIFRFVFLFIKKNKKILPDIQFDAIIFENTLCLADKNPKMYCPPLPPLFIGKPQKPFIIFRKAGCSR
jgi:hypothetical protein